MKTDKYTFKIFRVRPNWLRNILSLSVLICVNLWLIFLSSCSTKPVDMRTLVPAETLVYLETNDLAAALQPIVDSKPFMEAAKSRPDFSALKDVQLAVAVTGFETSEEKLTDEHSVGRVQPRFVAVAETHAWNYQAVAFAEQKLGSFVANIYDSEPTLEKTDKNGGKYFKWTAADGRKAYALVIDSIVYFGNDESAIEKCLAVKRKEADSIAKAGKVKPTDPTTLASGYVSTDGIAQIANILGLKFAAEIGEDSEIQSAIAGILPQVLRNSVTNVGWSAMRTENGIEDKFLVSMPSDIADVFVETLAPSGSPDQSGFEMIPAGMPDVTLYDFRDAQLAWRSVLIVLQKQVDPVAGQIISELSGALFIPYGIGDINGFLGSVGPTLITMKVDDVTNMPVVVASIKDEVRLKKSLIGGLKERSRPDDVSGASLWTLDEGDLAVVWRVGKIMAGDRKAVLLSDQLAGSDVERPKLVAGEQATIHTTGVDFEFAGKLVDILAERKPDSSTLVHKSYSFTKTRFTKAGIERKTTSDFGLIGSIIAQLGGGE